MITLDVRVNGEQIDFIKVINVEKHKGKDYIYEVYRGQEDSSPIATVIHNREKPWWMLFKRVAEILEEEE